MRPRLFPFMFLAVIFFIAGIVIWGSVSPAEDLQSSAQARDLITLTIDGWTCASCEKDVHAALMSVPGVQSAEVSYWNSGAIVVVEPGKVEPDQLVQAIRGASNVFDTYQATVIPNGSLAIKKNKKSIFGNFWSLLFN